MLMESRQVESYLARQWWVFLLRGLAAVMFGVLAFAWPGLTLAALVLLWGAYALVDGAFALVAAARERAHRGSLILEGLAGIVAGIVTFTWPGLTALALVYVIGAWALVTGVLELAAAVRLRRVIRNEWLLVLSGITSVLLGLALFVAPGAGAVALVWLIASYSLFFGGLLIALALRLYNLRPRVPRSEERARAA